MLCSQFVRDDILTRSCIPPSSSELKKMHNAGRATAKRTLWHQLLVLTESTVVHTTFCFYFISLCIGGSSMSYFYWANVVVMLNVKLMLSRLLQARLWLLPSFWMVGACHNKWREVVNTKYDLLFGENYSSSCWYSVVKNYHKKIFFHISREEKNVVTSTT